MPAGDGIGPEIAQAVKQIFKAANVPIQWQEQHVGTSIDPTTNSFVSRANLDSVLVRARLACDPACTGAAPADNGVASSLAQS